MVAISAVEVVAMVFAANPAVLLLEKTSLAVTATDAAATVTITSSAAGKVLLSPAANAAVSNVATSPAATN